MLVFIAFSLVLQNDAEAQCAMCKAVAESGSDGEDQASIGEQLNVGVLFLMAIPYLFILVLPLILFRKKIALFFREFREIHK